MSDSIHFKENGDLSFYFDRTQEKREKTNSTSTTISNIDEELNNSHLFNSNNKFINSSSPIMFSNSRFKDKTHAFNPKNLIKEEDEEYDEITNAELDDFNSSIGLKPIKKTTFNFYSHQELSERVSKISASSLEESNLNSYKVNKSQIDEKETLDDYAKKLDYSDLDNDVFLDDSNNDMKNESDLSEFIHNSRKRRSDGSESQSSSDDRNHSISSTEEIMNDLKALHLNQIKERNELKLKKIQNETDLEKCLVCYYNDYIKPKYKNSKDLSPNESKNFEDFKELLINSSKQLNFNQLISSSNEINLNKTLSLLFFMEGVESAPTTPINKSLNENISSITSSISEKNSDESSSIKELEFTLISLYKKLKHLNVNPVIGNEIFISILTFTAEWPNLPETVKAKMQTLIQMIEIEAYHDAKNIQENLLYDFQEHVSNFISGISKLLTEMNKASKRNT